MYDRKYDQKLNIKTTGIREWDSKIVEYNRCESTPYRALNTLFNHYRFDEHDHIVDFGCGRGRVAFYIHHHFHIPVTGIEVHDQTLEEALQNKAKYRQRAKHIQAPIRLKFGLAEQYEIKPMQNKFYFFNPFSSKIFNKTIDNIITSLETHTRPADIILYYPLPKFKKLLKVHQKFRLLNKIKIPRAQDKHEKFLIYRFQNPLN